MIQNSNILLTSNSAFKPIQISYNLVHEVEAYGQQLYNEKKHIKFEKCTQETLYLHPFTNIIKDMVLSIYTDLQKKQLHLSNKFHEISGITPQLYKTICLLIAHNLVELDCKYSSELCRGMIFEKSFVQIFKRSFFEDINNHKILGFKQIDDILIGLCETDYKKKLQNRIYHLCSGSFLLIQKNNFSQTMKYLLRNMGKVFTEKNLFLTRHIRSEKKSKQITDVVNKSIQLICNYKNQDYIGQQINKVTLDIFQHNQSINKESFIDNLTKVADRKQKTSSLVWIYFDLLRIECIIAMNSKLKLRLQGQTTQSYQKTNFYTQQMQKLLSKCPYNGDDSCDCKKCQCVRRNRESAKLSQQKKRNAVQQLNPMKLRITQLEIKNHELQEQNQILRGIVNQMRDHPGIRQLLTSALEPISKVINDNNYDHNYDNPYDE